MTNFLYNPDRKSKEQLKAEFVVRTKMLGDIMQDIESSTMKNPEQHYLLVGQRGTGKTTLLNRVKYAIEDSEKVNTWLIPVIFSEEQYNVSELANLWENVAHNLEDYHGFELISKEMEQHITKTDFEEKCYDILEKHLNEKGKKLVLLIDNIGDILKKLEDKEVRRLRELMQTKPLMRFIAGSPFFLDTILDYKQPFFEFFKVLRLEGLNKEETQGLLLKLGDVFGEREKIETIVNETPERIETLRILSGGVPRTIALMFRIFIEHEHESSLKDLERVLDAVTPLYKHRMDDLPKQQQKIIDAVARHWDAISVKELKEVVRLESKVISAQLRQLEKNQIIEKRETNTKNHLYLLRERFWNIWYLMRYGRKNDSERVVWLVRFLESWCTDAEFENRIGKYISEVKLGSINQEAAQFYGEVYASIKKIQPQLRYLLKRNVPENISERINIKEEEALHLAKEYEVKNQPLEAVKVLAQPFKISAKTKWMIFEMLLPFKAKDVWQIIKELSGKEINNENAVVSSGIFITVLSYLEKFIFNDVISNNFESANEIAELISDVLNLQDEDNFIAEHRIITFMISRLIVLDQYLLADKIIKGIRKKNIQEGLRPIKYILLHFSEGTDLEKMNSFGPEIKDAAQSLIENIIEYKKGYTKIKSQKK